MRRTPLELAAIASAAVPGLAPTGVAGAPDDAADFDSAVLIDDAGKQWRVRSPKHAEASMRLETELLVLRGFTPAIRAELPFRMPSVAGTARQGDLRTFVYNHLPGSTRDIESLVAMGGATAAEIGRVIAAIHDLPAEIVDHADLPSYTANEFRQRKLNELDQAATTGLIPPSLLRRWEHALEDVNLWRFNPSVVHGDLHEDNILIQDGSVTAVAGWTDLRIGDPADDFAWLVAAHEQSFADTVLEAYTAARRDAVDPHLMRRAALSAEFALAQWLVRGIAARNPDMIAEAEEMLGELDADVAAEEAESRAAAAETARTVRAEDDARAEAATATAAEARSRAAAVPTSLPQTAVGKTAVDNTAVGKAAAQGSQNARPAFTVSPIPADQTAVNPPAKPANAPKAGAGNEPADGPAEPSGGAPEDTSTSAIPLLAAAENPQEPAPDTAQNPVVQAGAGKPAGDGAAAPAAPTPKKKAKGPLGKR